MSYASIYATAGDSATQQRIQAALVKAATLILGEAKGTMSQTQTDKRQVAAKAVISGQVNFQQWQLVICTHPTVEAQGTSVTDSELDAAISSLWDDLSGVTTLDKQ